MEKESDKIKEYNIKIEISDENDTTVVWNYEELEKAISAIIRTGIDSLICTDNKKRELKIKIDDLGGFVHIEVKDNGVGMNEVDLNNIFDPFYDKNEISGEGVVSLAFTYDSLRKNGAEVEVESELGKGRLFKISLPKEEVLKIFKDE